ncbi:hypothetical protein IV102_32020 [bacterium]|nr:hypothetical protein [bacterium]
MNVSQDSNWLYRDQNRRGTVYRVDFNQNDQADPEEPILVRRGPGGLWKPVEKLSGPVDRFSLDRDYSLWLDSERSHMEKVWFWSRRVVDPKNGRVETDELVGFDNNELGMENPLRLGGEIVQDRTGGHYLDQHFYEAGVRIMDSNYKATMREHRANDRNWQVKPSASQS